MAHYEIEIKTLLGAAERAEALKQKMQTLDPSTTCVAKNKQLNHYFEGGDIKALYEVVKDLFSAEDLQKLSEIVERGSDFSVRTRQKDEEVLLVVKASVDGGTSENTVSRLEFEEPVNLTLDELDALVIGAGYTYQAKWSREREEYLCRGTNVCLDKNAGYGYLAEFERVVPEGSDLASVKDELASLMNELEVVELSQERLARMFEHYNQNWADYYGTDKVFNIE